MPFKHSSGPKTAKIAIVGEAFGKDEELLGLPFQGWSGQELTRMLKDVGILRSDCFLTNVFAFKPENNDIKTLCSTKKDLPEGYGMPPIQQGQYIRPEFLGEVSRLKAELDIVNPNIIIALGNTACWALLRTTKIGSIRGVIAPSTLILGTKVLPTYHPAGVLRNWAWRPIVLADLMKAKKEALFPEIIRPVRYILVDPTLDEIKAWIKKYVHEFSSLSVDIETFKGQISMIGFSIGRDHAMVIPFVDKRKTDFTYWPNSQDEITAWRLVGTLLESPCKKIFQNGLFDLQYIIKMGFRVNNCSDDTMLLHHSLYPELQKGLAFMGSIYTQESSWKLARARGKEEFKRDE